MFQILKPRPVCIAKKIHVIKCKNGSLPVKKVQGSIAPKGLWRWNRQIRQNSSPCTHQMLTQKKSSHPLDTWTNMTNSPSLSMTGSDETDRMVVVATETGLEVLSGSDHWFMDRTSTTYPRQFKQTVCYSLLSWTDICIHVMVCVWRTEHRLVCWLLYCFLSIGIHSCSLQLGALLGWPARSEASETIYRFVKMQLVGVVISSFIYSEIPLLRPPKIKTSTKNLICKV